MAVTVEDLRREVGAPTSQLDALQKRLDDAVIRVDKYIEDFGSEEVPPEVVDSVYLALGVDLWSRRNAPHGIINEQYDAGTGAVATPIRISRDPLNSVRPLLREWCYEPGIA